MPVASSKCSSIAGEAATGGEALGGCGIAVGVSSVAPGGGEGMAAGSAAAWLITGTGDGAGDPNPPRAQSTTLLAAILPQMSSPGGVGAVPATGVDHSEAGDIAGAGAPQVDVAGSTGAARLAPQSEETGAAETGTDDAASGDGEGDIDWAGAAGGAPHPDGAEDGGGADVSGTVPGAAQLCDIGPPPEIADAVGTESQPEALAGDADAAPPPASHPCHSGGGGAALRWAIADAVASSSAAAISNCPMTNTSPDAIGCGAASRASLPRRKVPFVLTSTIT